ncbi:MAG: signal transduction histidine kinase [Litorivivens sp.]|jgi:signal transduction histidine kinase
MRRLLAFSMFCFWCICFLGQSESGLEDNRIGESLVQQLDLQYFEDESGKVDFSSVLNQDFINIEQNVPNLGVSKSTFWIRFLIINDTGEDGVLFTIENPSLDFVGLYWNHGEGERTEAFSENQKFGERQFKSPFPMFNLDVSDGESGVYYLEIKGREQIQLPMTIGKKTALMEHFSGLNFWIGIYAGIILFMALYNMSIFFAIRDKSYLIYVLFILAVGCAQLINHGVLFEYVYPNLPWLASIGFFIYPALAGITGMVFQREFLQVKKTLPKSTRLIVVFVSIYAVSAVTGIWFDHVVGYHLMQVCAMMVSVYLLYVSIVLARRKLREANFFLIAWSFFLIGVILFILKDNGVIPYNQFTKHSMEIGSALELVLLSIALADKINIYKKEKEESQAQALEALQENERIVKEQNIVLEKKVVERTSALQQSNNDLGVAINDLQQTQAQLVDAEKMASLGQMTAGIAHELNNPINFVSSNISPLKRDIMDVFEVIDLYGEVNEANITGKLSEISELKEDLELDYVRDEIDQLLNGIADGAERTAEIVKGLRVFSRLDEDALKMADVNECIRSTLVILRSNFKNICVIETSFDSNIIEINCFPGKLNQVFMNILNNAVQATTYTDMSVEKRLVNVITQKNKENVVITIKDNGNGIKPEDQSKIFDPFFTTKKVGEGTGLGLSIALGIINDHKGTIQVNSSEGNGSEFILTLPSNL